MTTPNKATVEERVWVFVASRDGVPYFSKLFTDHTEMKEFSAKHSRNIESYSSTYYDLTDKTLLNKAHQQGERAGMEKGIKATRRASPTLDSENYSDNVTELECFQDGFDDACGVIIKALQEPLTK